MYGVRKMWHAARRHGLEHGRDQAARLMGIAGSIGTVGDALDNAPCEPTIGLFKTEGIHDGGPTWKNRAEVECQVAGWVRWYNHHRLQSAVGHLPPLEFEQTHRQAKTVVPVPEAAQPPTLRETQGGSMSRIADTPDLLAHLPSLEQRLYVSARTKVGSHIDHAEAPASGMVALRRRGRGLHKTLDAYRRQGFHRGRALHGVGPHG